MINTSSCTSSFKIETWYWWGLNLTNFHFQVPISTFVTILGSYITNKMCQNPRAEMSLTRRGRIFSYRSEFRPANWRQHECAKSVLEKCFNSLQCTFLTFPDFLSLLKSNWKLCKFKRIFCVKQGMCGHCLFSISGSANVHGHQNWTWDICNKGSPYGDWGLKLKR